MTPECRELCVIHYRGGNYRVLHSLVEDAEETPLLVVEVHGFDRLGGDRWTECDRASPIWHRIVAIAVRQMVEKGL